MFFSSLPKQERILLSAIAKRCRETILEMTTYAKSGHPGGSLSSIDILTFLYTTIISKTDESVVISNGHISPAVYSILSEFGVLPRQEVVGGFRQAGSIYEGHVSRQVPGVVYGTGPLGTGISAAAGLAYGEKLRSTEKYVYALLGDGEADEGQVYEMMNFAAKYSLSNLIVFMDRNEVQLSAATKEIMPVSYEGIFRAAGWNVQNLNGHKFTALDKHITKAKRQNKPTLLICHTIMGKGVSFMEKEGKNHRATWHGKAATEEQITPAKKELTLSGKEAIALTEWQKTLSWKPTPVSFPNNLTPDERIRFGSPIVYDKDTLTDCRSAYGAALLALTTENPEVVVLTADLAESVKTDKVRDAFPHRHIECGVAEQHMISAAGGLSVGGFVPFASTFGVFMTSRAKDQARVNDINQTNVKMVATHCGLSVGEDGPTHQAIDDIGSMLGLFNTFVLEPADPNHADRLIRFAATHHGNMYVRMGRHKLPTLTKEDGSLFFDATYRYTPGKTDVFREGTDVTVITSGPMVFETLKARDILKQTNNPLSVEIVIVSSPNQFGDTLRTSLEKTKRVLVIEDHNPKNGYASQIAQLIATEHIQVDVFKNLGVEEYQTSGTAEALYKNAGLSGDQIATYLMKHF